MSEYPSIRTVPFRRQEPMFDLVTRDIPNELTSASELYPELFWQGSVGKGKWADAPWVAVFDPLVTDSAQYGYYPVYLFTRSLDAVYLSMNQGMTELRGDHTAEEARDILRRRAALIRTRLRDRYELHFPLVTIALQHTGPSTRLAFYEPGHAFGCRYARGAVPSDEHLLRDARQMVELYAELTAKGGVSELPLDVQEPLEEESLEEARKVTFHRRIERRPKLAQRAKEIHGTTCQACGFDFNEFYGSLGRGYIEAHHRIPLASLAQTGEPVSQNPRTDFVVLCANCHRMVHRKGAPARFEDFVASVRRRRSEPAG